MPINERVIFDAAVEIPDSEARLAFVVKACEGDAELQARVLSLLKSHTGAGSFLEIPAAAPLGKGVAEITEKTIVGVPMGNDEDDSDDDSNRVDLSFLQPSAKAGSIGTLGHYEILKVLGQGGFGVVFKAFDEKLHRHVAIKVMNPQMAATSPPRKRFLREARSAAAIRHDNIVAVHSVEEQPLPYLVMEFIDGQTLQQKLDGNGPLDVTEVLYLGQQIASGLAAAHALSLIHRDIKPGNILIEGDVEQKVKITDFGLARASDDASLTRSGMISGTPMYMAPEQATGQALDHRTDLFSLGSVLYQMACGRPPFRAPNTVAVLRRVAEDTPRALQEIVPELPDWLVAIINKLLAKKPEDRYQSAKEVAELLGKCRTELQISGKVTGVEVPFSGPELKSIDRENQRKESAKKQTRPSWGRIASSILIGVAMLLPIFFGKQISQVVSPLIWGPIPQLPVVERAAGLRFDGKDDFIQVPAQWDTPLLTIEVFVTPDGFAEGGTVLQLTNEKRAEAESIEFFDEPNQSQTAQSFAGAVGRDSHGTVAAPLNRAFRQHRVVTVDHQYMHYYVNGKWQGKRRVQPHDQSLWKLRQLTIGCKEDRTNFFTGVIDQLRISKVIRYTENFSPITNVSSDDATLALYDFDEGTGDVLADSSGNGNEGRILGATWVHPARGLQFDGVDDYIDFEDLGWTSNQYTLETWITPLAEHGTLFQIAVPEGNLHAYLYSGGSGTGMNRDKPYTNVNGPRQGLKRQHLASVFDGRNLNYFINGKLVGSKTNISDLTTPWTLQRMRIGGKLDPDANKPEFFHGRMEQFRVSKSAKYVLPFTPEERLSAGEETLGLYNFDEGTGEVLKDASGNGHDGKIVGAKWVKPTRTDSRQESPERALAEWVFQQEKPIVWIDDSRIQITRVEDLPDRPYYVAGFVANVFPDSFGDRALRQISEVSRLETIMLRPVQGGLFNRITDLGFQEIANSSFAPRLKTLDLFLNCPKVTSAAIGSFNSFAELESLNIESSQINSDALLSLHLPKLRHFGLNRVRISQSFVSSIPAQFPNLTSLGLVGMDLGNTDIASLAPLAIDQLDLSWSKLPTSDPASLKNLSKLPNLKVLNLISSEISDNGLESLMAIKTLERLSLEECKNVTEAGVRKLQAALPKCEILSSFSGTGWHGWPSDAPAPAIAPFNAEQAKQHQEAWAKYLNVPVEYTNSIGMKFRLIPPGEFTMGSTQEEIDGALKDVKSNDKHWQECIQSEAPQHKVILTQPFYLGVNEVTQAEYEQVIGANPSYFAAMGMGKDAVAGLVTANHPVETVNWNDAAEFCEKLSNQEQLKPFYFRADETITPLDGTGYRLPSEAEWEFACRAGTTTKFWISDKDQDLVLAGWFGRNAKSRTHAVGDLKANPLGLYDMHGNVWEWVQDAWDTTCYGQFEEKAAINPSYPRSADSQHVLRGGDWFNASFHCRSSHRNSFDTTGRGRSFGFRVSLTIDAVKATTAKRESKPAGTAWQGWPADAPAAAIAPFNAEQAKQHQEAWAKYLNVPVEYTNSMGMKFRLIPPGEFMMGSSPEEIAQALGSAGDDKLWQETINSEGPQHKVVLTKATYVGVHEVTQEQFEQVMGRNPSRFGPMGASKDAIADLDTTSFPVEKVSWDEATRFCVKLGKEQGLSDDKACRLLTDAEWEFACRAGTTTEYWIGENEQERLQTAWLYENSSERTHAVGELKENPFGLCDVHGNVWEWVQDAWDPTFYGQLQGQLAVDPIKPSIAGAPHVTRGGCWSSSIASSRSTSRCPETAAYSGTLIGFRVSLAVEAVRETLKSTP